MKNNDIIFSYKRRNKLKILIEDFLDRDWGEILEDKKNDEINLRSMIITIGEGILLPYRYYEDELEEHIIPDLENGEYSSNTTDDDRLKLLFTLHRNLKPFWNELKKKICNHKWPQKELIKKKIKTKNSNLPVTNEQVLCYYPTNDQFEYKENGIDDTKINFPEFENLASEQSEIDKLEIYENIVIPKPRPITRDRDNKFSSIEIKVNFNGEAINLIREDVDLINNFIEFMKGIPLNVFDKCEKCGKLIIITRKDRKTCSNNCASGIHQMKKWKTYKQI